MDTELWVEFSVFGLDPKFVSDTLGLKPTRSWREGDEVPNTESKGKRQSHRWTFARTKKTNDFTQLLDEITDVIKTRTNGLLRLGREPGFEAELMLVIYSEEGQGPLAQLSNSQLDLISSLGFTLTIETYFMSSQNESPGA